MAKGVVYKGVNGVEIQYTIDANQVPTIGYVNFGGTIVGTNGTVSIGGVNTDTPNNTVGIYNPTYFKGTNQSNVTEVQVRYVDGDNSFAFGKPCKLEVVNTPSAAGDMDVPAQGLTLSGRGSTAAYIAALKPGDQLTLTLNATMNGADFTPSEIISGNTSVLVGGNVVYNGDTSVHPRTVLGYSQDGKKVIFLVVTSERRRYHSSPRLADEVCWRMGRYQRGRRWFHLPLLKCPRSAQQAKRWL